MVKIGELTQKSLLYVIYAILAMSKTLSILLPNALTFWGFAVNYFNIVLCTRPLTTYL